LGLGGHPLALGLILDLALPGAGTGSQANAFGQGACER
jgi:hypothetical protein